MPKKKKFIHIKKNIWLKTSFFKSSKKNKKMKMIKNIKNKITIKFLTLAILIHSSGINMYAGPSMSYFGSGTSAPATSSTAPTGTANMGTQLQNGVFTSTSGNAFNDAQTAGNLDTSLNSISNNMTNSIDNMAPGESNNLYGAILSPILGSAGGIVVKNAIPKGRKVPNDIGARPIDWKIPKLKPWQIALIAAFIALELRELGSNGNNEAIVKNSGVNNTPLGQINNSLDPRVHVIVTIFKTFANICDKIGKTLNSAMGAFAFALIAIETAFLTLKNMFEEEAQPGQAFINTLKNNIVNLIYSVLIMFLLTSRLLWKFYTGVLFGFSMKVGGLLSGQNFTLNDLPKYIGKIINAPINIILSSLKMMLNPTNLINSYLPILGIVCGIVLLFIVFKAAIEMMQVFIDYLIIGLFGTITLAFSLFSLTKSIGTGILNGILAAMVNVMIMFTILGIFSNILEQLNVTKSINASELLGQVVLIFTMAVLLKQVKNIGLSINSGTNGFVSGDMLMSEAVSGVFDALAIAAVGMGIAQGGAKVLGDQLKAQGMNFADDKLNAALKESGFSFGDKFKAGLSNMNKGETMSEIGKNVSEKVNDLNSYKTYAQSLVSGDVQQDPMGRKQAKDENKEVKPVQTGNRAYSDVEKAQEKAKQATDKKRAKVSKPLNNTNNTNNNSGNFNVNDNQPINNETLNQQANNNQNYSIPKNHSYDNKENNHEINNETIEEE